MDKAKARRIVIVGGGSAGWMAAAFLSKVFGLEKGCPYTITVVESQEVPPIGVGEATIHTMRQFLSAAGVQEGNFLSATDAILKHGILFRDWYGSGTSSTGRDQYFHSFENYPPIAPELLVNHWLNARHRGACTDRYDLWSGVQSGLAAGNVSPKDWQAKPYEGIVPYGYHLDANKFAHFLKGTAVLRGVAHIVRHITGVRINEGGNIEALLLDNEGVVEGDFFIDCSGFAAVLMSKLGAKFISYSNKLFVDRAVTARIEKNDHGYVPRPYTTATARDAGWTFDIDLSGRTGFGYIFSSAHIQTEEAERRFRSWLESDQMNVRVNHLGTKVGRLEEAWISNCLAIGLSAGFLEPLESTGLYFIELALRLFVDYIDLDDLQVPLRAQYNRIVSKIFDESAAFILLHYILTTRNDTPFWRDVQAASADLPSNLHDRLELWRFKAPTDADFIGPTSAFGASNYSAIIYGMQRLTVSVPGTVRHIPVEQSLSYYEALNKLKKQMLSSLPRHDQYLKKYKAAFS